VRTALGVTTARPAPRLAARPFRRSPTAVAHRDDPEASVVVWPDTFTDAFRPAMADDLVAVLEAVGERVAVPSRWGCCGRPLYDAGMLGLARRTLTGLLDVLEPWTSRGVPVVVPEPSCLSTFRDELPALLWRDPRARLLASLARSPAEHLVASSGFAALVSERAMRSERDRRAQRVVVHPHCQGRAAGLTAADRQLLGQLGFEVEVLDAGCCGLAGSFGYSHEHEALSRRIGEEYWLPRVRRAVGAGDELVLDGFSCATQLAHLSDLRSTTLVALVRRALLVDEVRPG
jgi:Fe-S oxidoreductase